MEPKKPPINANTGMESRAFDSFQFVRNGFYCVDYKDSKDENLVFNRIVSLKSSFVLPKND